MQNDRANRDLENAFRGLRAQRNKAGAESDRGRLMSNVDEQSDWLTDPDPRPWATHPMQTVQGMMKWQVELLAGGTA